jgi:hypothetical protein
MLQSLGLLALLGILSLTAVAIALFTVAWLIPRAIRDIRKQWRKTVEEMRGPGPVPALPLDQEGLSMKWEFQRRYEQVLARVRDRVELAVDGEVTAEDYLAWYRRAQRRQSPRKRVLNSRVLWALALVALAVCGAVWAGWNWTLVTLLCAIAAFMLFLPSLIWWSAGKNVLAAARKHALRGIVGPHRWLFTADSFIEVNEVLTLVIPWGNLHALEEDEGYTYLCLGPSPRQAVIFPRHGFASPQEYERAAALAKECYERARTLEKAPAPVTLEPVSLLSSPPSQDIRT